MARRAETLLLVELLATPPAAAATTLPLVELLAIPPAAEHLPLDTIAWTADRLLHSRLTLSERFLQSSGSHLARGSCSRAQCAKQVSSVGRLGAEPWRPDAEPRRRVIPPRNAFGRVGKF